MHLEQVFCYLVVVIGFYGALELNTTPCVKNCIGKTFLEPKGDKLCGIICLQESLSNVVKKAVDSEKLLPIPATPRLVEAEWQTIRLNFSSTELKSYSDLDYILEVRPNWGRQERGKFFAVFPYTKKYHYTNQSTYLIEDLEPNTGYQFRVIALQFNKSSSFSNWSEIINTTRNCTKPSCGVTNIHLELTSRKPYQRVANLKSNFSWEPSVRISEENQDSFRRLSLLSANDKYCGDYFLQTKEWRIDFGAKNLKDENKSFYSFDRDSDRDYDHLEYNCWYKFEVGARRYPSDVEFASRSLIFRVPDCIRINSDDICGCDYVEDYKHKTRHINVTFGRSSPNTITMFLFWSDLNWRKSVNLTYFFVRLEQSGKHFFKKYVKASHNVTHYNITIHNLISGKDYYLRIYGFYNDHCTHKDVEELSFLDKPTVTKSDNNKGVIAAAILTPLVVILLAICVIIWLKKRHKKQMNSMEPELEFAIDRP